MTKKKKYIFIFTVVTIAVISIFILLQQRERINIILVVIDALRPDHLGCYGYQRNTSPNIDGLSKREVRFTQAITAAGHTIESVPSILTGTHSLTHQVRDYNDLRNPSINTLVRELTAKGYQCVFFSNYAHVKFTGVKDDFQEVYIGEMYEDERPIINAHLLTIKVIDWLKTHKNNPFFLYVHYWGSHAPYRPPEPYKSMYLHDEFRGEPKFVAISNLSLGDKHHGKGAIPYIVAENDITDVNYYISQYDGAISYTDAQIGRLIDNLKKLGLDKNTLIILTADHAEMLGEHDTYFSHGGCYDENIRVPLIIKFPKLSLKGRVISRQVSLIDIAPTILEVAGLDKPSYMQGESLLAIIEPYRTYQTKYVFSSYVQQFALRTKEWKLIKNDSIWELYNLNKDPKEQHNLVYDKPYKFRQLKQVLENWKKHITSLIPARKGPPLTEENKERLRSLEYVQ